MLDPVARHAVGPCYSLWAVDVVGGHALLFGDLQQMNRVGRVEATDDKGDVHSLSRRSSLGDAAALCGGLDLFGRKILLVFDGHQVHADLLALQLFVQGRGGRLVLCIKHVVHGVLPLLSGVADRVEGDEVLIDLLRTVLLNHDPFEQLCDQLGLALEHCCLVCHSNTLQVHVWVETITHGLCKLLHELLAVALAQNVVCHILSLRHVLHSDVLRCKRLCCHSFLMVVLGVDD
mmetsp:Transcript_105353/g.192296  ORF Transcript_105353/g.192296 Transcript_105353/m.192296 type:complete len:233 (-) Transcript_105353:692-1390(-)